MVIIPKSVRKVLFHANAQNHRRIIELSKEYIKPKKNTKILDLGSGDGILIDKVREAVHLQPKNIHCCELHPKYAAMCKKKGFNVKKFDVNETFPYKDNTFDYVIANQIIEHLYFTDHFVKEIKRVVKKNGIVIISTTNLAAIHYRILLLFGFMPNGLHPSEHIVGTLFKKKGTNPLYGHKSVFTGKAFKEFMKLHKYSILKYETQSVILVPEPLSSLLCTFFQIGTHVNIVAKK